MRSFFGKISKTFEARRPDRHATHDVRPATHAFSRIAGNDERALDPRQGLIACNMATWEWDLASDELSWGPTARHALGNDRRRKLSTGKAWAALVTRGSGESRADVIQGAHDIDHGDGVPFRCRYVVNAGRGLALIEERGRWHAGSDGSPARAEGVMRVCPIDLRQPDPSLFGQRMEPSRDIVTRTLAAMLHDPNRSLRSVSVGVCILAPASDGVSVSDPGLMEAASAAIAQRLRRTDIVAVLDPGQFVILLNGCDSGQGRQAASAVARNIERGCPGVSVHVGLVTASDGVGDAASLLERANEAARQAADAAHMVAVLSPRMRRRTVARPLPMSPPDVVTLLNGREIALRRRRLVELDGADLRFEEAMPVVACPGGKGAMGPGLLTMAASGANLSMLLDHRMLELTVRLLANDPTAHMLLRIASSTLVSPEWRAALAAWLAAHPGVSSRLVIALDEAAFRPDVSRASDAIAGADGPNDAGRRVEGYQAGADTPGLDPRAIAQHLSLMKALGVGVGVAGYGLGWLTLDDLSAMAVDLVCINGLFVNESLSPGGPDRFVVRALIDGVREVGAPVVAPTP